MKPFALLIFAGVCCADCLPISGDRILGVHVAMADPSLAALPPSAVVGFAPLPGQPRVFSSAEVSRLAKANGIVLSGPPADLCFAFAMQKISAEDAIAAMRPALPPSAMIEVIELPSAAFPVGELHFPITSLEPGPDVRIWRGYAQYTPTRRSPAWARVRIRYELEALVLTSDVARGAAIPDTAYQVRAVTGVPLKTGIAVRPQQVTGVVAKTQLKAGDTIPLSALDYPPTIHRGDVVRVDVRSGTARLQLDAVAQKNARDGDVVDFLNPASGKIFRARLEGSTPVVTVGGQF